MIFDPSSLFSLLELPETLVVRAVLAIFVIMLYSHPRVKRSHALHQKR
jgi:hypothetical protein